MQDRDWFADRLAQLQIKSSPSEADVREHLIRRVLTDILDFSIGEINAEESKGLRPDYVCRRHGSGAADVIVEVKSLKTDLFKRRGKDFASSPVGQLYRYLNSYRDASSGTWGIVTNGTHWLVVQRHGDKIPPTAFGEPQRADLLAEIREILAPVKERPKSSDAVHVSSASDWFAVAAECSSPEAFVKRVGRSLSIAENVQTHTKGGSSWTRICEIDPPEEQLFPRNVYLACLKLDYPDGLISPHDISEELLQCSLDGRVAGIAFTGPSKKMGGG